MLDPCQNSSEDLIGDHSDAPKVKACIGIGANQGARTAQCHEAVARLEADPAVRVCVVSDWFETAPVGPVPQGDFINGVVVVETTLVPEALLALCLSVETEMGRVRETRWGPRVIDLDILLYGDRVIDSTPLVVPHPAMCERGFVMVPLAQVAPDWLHPLKRETMAELAEALNQRLAIGEH